MNIRKLIEKIIFSSKWFLIIFYMGLIITMMTYTFVFIKEIWHLVMQINIMKPEGVLIATLEIVDIVMIANLIKMIITGSYTSFVDKYHSEAAEKVSSGLLKVKMATSLIGVSSIHLLASFINAKSTDWSDLYKQMAVHAMFLIGALILAIVNYLHEKLESHENLSLPITNRDLPIHSPMSDSNVIM